MKKPLPNDESLVVIMSLLGEEAPNILDLCDLIYHYNKSLGLTYTKIRQEITDLDIKLRYNALKNFLMVIDEMKSPNLFIQIDNSES